MELRLRLKALILGAFLVVRGSSSQFDAHAYIYKRSQFSIVADWIGFWTMIKMQVSSANMPMDE